MTDDVVPPEDRAILRDLAMQYMEVCESDRNKERIALWRDHNNLRRTRAPVYCSHDYAALLHMEIRPHLPDPRTRTLRGHEMWFHRQLWSATIPDDHVYYPWVTVRAPMRQPEIGIWGFESDRIHDEVSRGWRDLPVIHTTDDLDVLRATPHEVIDAHPPEAKRLEDILGDIMPVHVRRSTVYGIWGGTDLSEAAGTAFGLEELLYALYDKPDVVHRLMAFMRDAVIANLRQGEAAGDWSTAESQNYGVPAYCHELPDPGPNTHGAKLSDLCFFTHAQEFETVSPEQHEQFLLDYQMPIMELFGLVNYGCCESLHNKIEMLRAIPNLRKILVGPNADFRKCIDEIGGDYIASWRPSPATMVTGGFDPDSVRRQIREALAYAKDTNIEVMLKEMMTLDGDISRLFKWAEIGMEESERAA